MIHDEILSRKNVQGDPKSTGFDLLFLVHAQPRNGGPPSRSNPLNAKRASRESKMPLPSITAGIEKRNLIAGLGVGSGDVPRFVSVAGDAAQRVIGKSIETFPRGWNDVLDMIGRSGNHLRRAAILATGPSALLNQNSVRTAWHQTATGTRLRFRSAWSVRAFSRLSRCALSANCSNSRFCRAVSFPSLFNSINALSRD